MTSPSKNFAVAHVHSTLPLLTVAYGYFFPPWPPAFSVKAGRAVSRDPDRREWGNKENDPCVQTSGGWKRGTGLGSACRAETIIDKFRAGAGKSPAARDQLVVRRRISPRDPRPITASPRRGARACREIARASTKPEYQIQLGRCLSVPGHALRLALVDCCEAGRLVRGLGIRR